jgi:hypothetical protein
VDLARKPSRTAHRTFLVAQLRRPPDGRSHDRRVCVELVRRLAVLARGGGGGVLGRVPGAEVEDGPERGLRGYGCAEQVEGLVVRRGEVEPDWDDGPAGVRQLNATGRQMGA